MARKLDKTDEMPTTGHEWDGIREYDTPMPRWWLWTFYGTIVFSLIYVILFPAIPLINSATPGLLGYSTREEVAKDIQAFRDANAELDRQLVETELTAIADDPDLQRYAVAGGAAVFRTNCAQCHGEGAGGSRGYPNLIDDAWLWGGTVDAIHTTVSHGIRSDRDPATRYSEMPAFGDNYLPDEEIAQIVEYVRLISGQEHDAGMSAAGETIFAEICSACHGEQGMGNQDLGAPNLTDAIWLYGGDREALIETVSNSRFGVMPPWADRLSEAQIRQVTVYVHQLGGGE